MVWKKFLHLQIDGFLIKTKIFVKIFQNISESPAKT